MAANNAPPTWRSQPTPLSDLASGVLDPVMRKRAGVSVALIQSWEEIAGAHVGRRSRPEKIQWPKRVREGGRTEPATLVIACESAAALEIQHETSEIIARVNNFFGYPAINSVKLVQKPILRWDPPPRPAVRALSAEEGTKLAAQVAPVEDDGLRAALQRLGASVIARRR